jgi:hypothetical protein
MPARFPRSAGQTREAEDGARAGPLVPLKGFARAANRDPLPVASGRGHDWPRRRPCCYRLCHLDRCARVRRWKNNCDCKGGLSASLIMPQSPGAPCKTNRGKQAPRAAGGNAMRQFSHVELQGRCGGCARTPYASTPRVQARPRPRGSSRSTARLS